MDGLIPARGAKGREVLDSAFLATYARRIEGRAKWSIVGHVLMGALVGFGLGSLAVEVKAFATAFTGAGINLAALFGRPPAVEAEAFFWVYLPWMAAAVMAVVWGGRGLAKSDEMRFQAQMALHVLKIQDTLKRFES